MHVLVLLTFLLQVMQYDQDKDSWFDIGEMLESRDEVTMVEVPISFCQGLA